MKRYLLTPMQHGGLILQMAAIYKTRKSLFDIYPLSWQIICWTIWKTYFWKYCE